MKPVALLMRELHVIQIRLAEVRDKIARGPKQTAAAEAGLRKFEDDVAKAKEAHKQARMISEEKQQQLKQREFRLAELRTKLMQAESNTVYQAFKDQIAADEQANSVLTDEILGSLERLDELQAKVDECLGNVGKAKEEVERVKARVAEQRSELDVLHERTLQELRASEEKLPEEFRTEYLRVAKTKGQDALAPLEGESCGGCFQMLTPQTFAEVAAGRPIFCKTCGRLLYEFSE